MAKVLIIGAGPAGISAALYARRGGAEVTVVTKGIGTGGLAKAEKIPYRRAEDLFHPDTNIALGTRYLGRMAQRYAGATWLASAAYNAGAAPVERWLAARGALEPDFFVATIPYRETREYVARVLAVSVIYDWRMNREVLALGARMPRAGQAAAEALPRKAVACSADAGAAAAATAAAAPR